MLLKQLNTLLYIYIYQIIPFYDIYSKIFQWWWITTWMIIFPMSFALGKLVYKITQSSIYWADITSVFDGKAYKGASPGPIVLSRCRGARYLNYWGVLHKHIDEDVTDFKSASCHIHLLRLRTTSSVPQCYLVFLYRSDLPTNKA